MRKGWINFLVETLDIRKAIEDKINHDGGVIMKNTSFRPEKNPDNSEPEPITQYNSANSRYRVRDEGGHFRDGFDILDLQTKKTHKIDFAFAGTDNSQCSTWDFAPLGEMQEVDGKGFSQFRSRLHQDDRFVAQQLMMNRREDIFHNAGKGKGVTSSGLHMFSGQFRDPITQSNFFMTSDVRFGRNVPPALIRLEYYVNPLFKPIVRKVRNTSLLINKYLKLNRSGEDVLREYAEKKSDKLLRNWLSEEEYNSLMNLGELEIYADDEIYIVKKNPHDTVIVKKNNGRGDCQLKQEFCVIMEKMGYATGDILLSKIMMIKTDPENFKKVALQRR